MDLNIVTYGSLDNTVGSFLEWTVENLEGSKWNSFAMQTNTARTGYGFSVYGRWEASDEYTNALSLTGQMTQDRERVTWEAPMGLMGFRQFRFELNAVASAAVSTNAYVMQYCMGYDSITCPATATLPESPLYTTQTIPCDNNQLGSVQYTCTEENEQGVWVRTKEQCVKRSTIKGSASVTIELKAEDGLPSNYDDVVDAIRHVVSEKLKLDAKSVAVVIKNRVTVYTPSQQYLSYSAIRQHKSRNNYAVRNKDTQWNLCCQTVNYTHFLSFLSNLLSLLLFHY